MGRQLFFSRSGNIYFIWRDLFTYISVDLKSGICDSVKIAYIKFNNVSLFSEQMCWYSNKKNIMNLISTPIIESNKSSIVIPCSFGEIIKQYFKDDVYTNINNHLMHSRWIIDTFFNIPMELLSKNAILYKISSPNQYPAYSQETQTNISQWEKTI